ncbi:MAG: hypothetical protein RH946_15455 [Rhodospirillales bacterium]
MSNAKLSVSASDDAETDKETDKRGPQPNQTQLKWLQRGLDQPGGKLPLFDRIGQKVSEQTVRSCIRHGWAEPWFNNPIKPDWLVCRLTDSGRSIASDAPMLPDDD